MSIQDFMRILRSRWLIVCVTVVVSVLGAMAVNLLTPPLYEASTRLFVSTNAGGSVETAYTGNRLTQERIASYTELVTGETLAQRTIAKLGLAMSPDLLRENIKATSKVDSVLISVRVRDKSPNRARDIADALSNEFVVMVGELETPADGTPPDVRVVVEQHASIPDAPISPQTRRNLLVGLAFGLLLGVGLAFLRDRLDNTIKERDALEAITGVGLVGSIPLDKTRRSEPGITFDGDDSPGAEAFRKLRTNLQFLAVDNPPRVIVVTSSVTQEGKSTTAINFALALAEGDHDVVLVDGDLRRPSLANYLDLVGTTGFSTVLAGRASIADVLQITRFPRLFALTSGAVPPNPSELLGSLAAQKVLSELRSRFDYVVVDSSPLLAVTDAAILAANADGVLLVARFGETKTDQLAQAVRNLGDVDAALLGAIFTMTPPRGNASVGYYAYKSRGR